MQKIGYKAHSHNNNNNNNYDTKLLRCNAIKIRLAVTVCYITAYKMIFLEFKHCAAIIKRLMIVYHYGSKEKSSHSQHFICYI